MSKIADSGAKAAALDIGISKLQSAAQINFETSHSQSRTALAVFSILQRNHNTADVDTAEPPRCLNDKKGGN